VDQETLNLIATFLNRVQLQGNEVPAFNKVMTALQREAELLNMATVAEPEKD